MSDQNLMAIYVGVGVILILILIVLFVWFFMNMNKNNDGGAPTIQNPTGYYSTQYANYKKNQLKEQNHQNNYDHVNIKINSKDNEIIIIKDMELEKEGVSGVEFDSTVSCDE